MWPRTPDPRCSLNSEPAPDLVRLVWLFSHALWRGLQTPLPDWDTARPWRKRKRYKRVGLRNKNPWADHTRFPSASVHGLPRLPLYSPTPGFWADPPTYFIYFVYYKSLIHSFKEYLKGEMLILIFRPYYHKIKHCIPLEW